MPELKDIKRMLHEQGYITDDSVAMSVFLSLQLNKPLLIEGPAGVGKTEIAKVMANALQTDLIRLQCYEGLDATHALYEWNYQRQLLHLKMVEHNQQAVEEKEKTIFSDSFLMKRPLLQAITHDKKTCFTN
jgi:MoxR-like ATPase